MQFIVDDKPPHSWAQYIYCTGFQRFLNRYVSVSRNEKSKSESKRTKKFTNLNNEMLIYNDSARGSVGFSTFFLRVLPLPRPEP